MPDQTSLPAAPRGGFTARGLIKAIFDAEAPEQFVRRVPAQSLFIAIKQNGLVSSADLVEMATLEQCRLLIDFDCWHGDRFNEDNFWEWLALSDEDNSLRPLQKLLKFVDLKILGLLLSKYVKVLVMEEASEQPPLPRSYTPDGGRTWLAIEIEDGTKHFLLARLLALIFETDAELFYQLIAVPGVATYSVLEEESFQERSKRLAAEGIPDEQWSAALNAPLPEDELQQSLRAECGRQAVESVIIVEPMVYDGWAGLQPLSTLLSAIQPKEEFEAEMTLLFNAALVHWRVDFDRLDAVRLLLQKVRGAMNIGLETARSASPLPVEEIHRALGLQRIYRAGLTKIFGLRSLARRRKHELEDRAPLDGPSLAILEAAALPFPEMPAFFSPDGSFKSEDNHLISGSKAIETGEEIDSLMRALKSIGN